MAKQYNTVDLGQGYPSFDPDKGLIQAVNQAMLDGYNQYPEMAGVKALRDVLAQKINSLYGYQYHPDTEITITSGATEAIMVAIQTVIRPGDEVIVIEPFYDMYVPCIELAGGSPVFVPLDPPSVTNHKYSLNWNKVATAITPKTRLIILNFPHNPTGITLKSSDLDALEEIVRNRNLYILADEVYEHIVFHHKFLSLSTRPNLAQRSFVVGSFGKTYNTTGWKIGFCAAPAELTKEFRKIHQFTVFTVPSPMQHGLANFASNPETYLHLSDFYQKYHDYLFTELQDKTRFKPLRSEGTFFLLASYADISDKKENDFVIELTQKHGVTAIPISAFYMQPDSVRANNRIVRFCFAKKFELLEEAVTRLAKL